MDSRNMRTVKELWAVFEHDGLAASTEAMLGHAAEDLEVRPFAAQRRVLRGPEEVREHLDERAASGVQVDTNAWSFEEDGDKGDRLRLGPGAPLRRLAGRRPGPMGLRLRRGRPREQRDLRAVRR